MEALVADYNNQGPNNEAYLKAGQAVAFQLITNRNPETNNYHIHLGVKLAQGNEAKLLVGETGLATLKTATNMFYDLGDLTWTQDGKVWYSEVIVLSNDKDSEGMISLTDLKVTSNMENDEEAGVTFGTYDSETFADETNPLIASVVTEEALSYAIRTMNTLYVTRDTSEDTNAGDGEDAGSEDTDIITPDDSVDSGSDINGSENAGGSYVVTPDKNTNSSANTVTPNNNPGSINNNTNNVVIPDLGTEAARRGIIPLPQLKWSRRTD